jgi:hypothetical protein
LSKLQEHRRKEPRRSELNVKIGIVETRGTNGPERVNLKIAKGRASASKLQGGRAGEGQRKEQEMVSLKEQTFRNFSIVTHNLKTTKVEISWKGKQAESRNMRGA